jgi:metal-responsive CopG/Arc/MetJ family transcriptional regulator
MKMEKRVKPQISITVDAEVINEVDRLALKMGLNRSQLIRNILAMGVADVKLLKKIGLIDLAHMIKTFQASISRELRVA